MKVGDFIGDYYQQISQNLLSGYVSSEKGRAIIFIEYISLCTYTVMQKTACL